MGDETGAESPLERYMRLVELIAGFPGGLALADVAELSDLPKTTAHRLLKGLVKAGLAAGGQGGKAYVIGPRLSRMLHSTADDGWLEVLVRPSLVALAQKSGEACYVTRLVGSRVFVVASQAPEVRWRSYVQPGIEMPPNAAATSKSIIAFQDEAVIRQALAADLPKLTVNTHTDETWIREEFARVRAQGYATCVGEVDEGLAALGAPVRQADGQVLYAVGLTGPLPRIMNDELPARLVMLTAAADDLSGRLALGTRLARDPS